MITSRSEFSSMQRWIVYWIKERYFTDGSHEIWHCPANNPTTWKVLFVHKMQIHRRFNFNLQRNECPIEIRTKWIGSVFVVL